MWLATTTTGPEAGRCSPSSISMLRKNTRMSRRANAVIDQSATRRRGRPRAARRRVRRSRPRHESQQYYGAAEISGFRIARVPQHTETGSGFWGVQAQKPRGVRRGFGHGKDHWHEGCGGGSVALLAHRDRGAPGPGDERGSRPRPATFGTLPSPCGKGHATGATDQGVTNSTINIALRRRPRLLGQPRARPGDGRRRQGDDRLV